MPGNDVPDWHYSHAPLDVQLDRQGVRGLELDLAWQSDVEHFEVYHVPLADEGTTCRLFTDCLRLIKRFSDDYPGHQPLFLQMEAKSGFRAEDAGLFFTTLEREILSVWPLERIVTPARVQGASASLREALLARGWPTLGELRSQILFAFDNTTEVRDLYTHGGRDLDGRLIFVDSGPADPFGAVAILNDPVGGLAEIRAALAAHLLVRTRADSNPADVYQGLTAQREAAFASGAQIVTTDFPAPVPGLAYVVETPGGTPSRCNPITAPPTCAPLAIEDPQFVGSQSP